MSANGGRCGHGRGDSRGCRTEVAGGRVVVPGLRRGAGPVGLGTVAGPAGSGGGRVGAAAPVQVSVLRGDPDPAAGVVPGQTGGCGRGRRDWAGTVGGRLGLPADRGAIGQADDDGEGLAAMLVASGGTDRSGVHVHAGRAGRPRSGRGGRSRPGAGRSRSRCGSPCPGNCGRWPGVTSGCWADPEAGLSRCRWCWCWW